VGLRDGRYLKLSSRLEGQGVFSTKTGELAERTSVPAKTIRFWEGEGLVPEPARTPSGYRDYDSDAADRIEFIRHAQTAGLNLAQIRQSFVAEASGHE
jgi:DNA-binding transcriptional MerR regulator